LITNDVAFEEVHESVAVPSLPIELALRVQSGGVGEGVVTVTVVPHVL
jgi:hypothetical protein